MTRVQTNMLIQCVGSLSIPHCFNTMDVQAVGRPIHDSYCRIICFYCIDCVFGIFVVLKNEVVANQLLASFWMVVQGNLTVLYLCNVHLSLFFSFLFIHGFLTASLPLESWRFMDQLKGPMHLSQCTNTVFCLYLLRFIFCRIKWEHMIILRLSASLVGVQHCS